jgi:hypothetical protein
MGMAAYSVTRARRGRTPLRSFDPVLPPAPQEAVPAPRGRNNSDDLSISSNDYLLS